MTKTKAFQIVLDDLKQIPMFTGAYDAKNGDFSFMHGIWIVMEQIAYTISDEVGDEFNGLFTENLRESERKAKATDCPWK